MIGSPMDVVEEAVGLVVAVRGRTGIDLGEQERHCDMARRGQPMYTAEREGTDPTTSGQKGS